LLARADEVIDKWTKSAFGGRFKPKSLQRMEISLYTFEMRRFGSLGGRRTGSFAELHPSVPLAIIYDASGTRDQ
jgi:hypothetical protein